MVRSVLVKWPVIKAKNFHLVQTIAYNSYNKSQQDALFLKFISIYNSTCFGQTYCPSSGVLILYSHQLVFVILIKRLKVKGRFMGLFQKCGRSAYCIRTPNKFPNSSPEAPRIIQMRETSNSEGGKYYH